MNHAVNVEGIKEALSQQHAVRDTLKILLLQKELKKNQRSKFNKKCLN